MYKSHYGVITRAVNFCGYRKSHKISKFEPLLQILVFCHKSPRIWQCAVVGFYGITDGI